MNAKRTFCLLIGSLLLSATSSSQDQPGQVYWQLRREASESFQKHDYRTLLPEGIAYDPKADSVFLSSMYHRKIVRFDSKGKPTDFVTARQNDIWSISGIGTDSVRRVLWACSNRFEGSEGYTAGTEKQ